MEHIVYDDCWQLLHRFGRISGDANAQFTLFCQCWHEMQMQHIYSAQTNQIEVIETTLAALHVAKRRIGGLYLLYVIYHKQPTKHFVKIEVSPRTWHSLVSFIEQLRLTCFENPDTQQVSFIFWQLAQENAFLFTALDYCHVLDAFAAYDSLEAIQEARQQKGSNYNGLQKHQLKPNIANLNEELHGLTELVPICKPLCQLEESYNTQMIRHRTSFGPTKIFSEIQDVFFKINELVPSEEKPSTSSMAKSQIEKRNQVRQKAMYGESKSKLNDNMDQLTEAYKEAHERRMSSATVFDHRLPDDVLKDLKS
ncbi:hypothetical protein KR215_010137 [Drosophila sulfurigaster]|nr:hypothetical protein KR215_010137 [Drosophila sulfurigaster]